MTVTNITTDSYCKIQFSLTHTHIPTTSYTTNKNRRSKKRTHSHKKSFKKLLGGKQFKKAGQIIIVNYNYQFDAKKAKNTITTRKPNNNNKTKTKKTFAARGVTPTKEEAEKTNWKKEKEENNN